jgi:hypothetical protein
MSALVRHLAGDLLIGFGRAVAAAGIHYAGSAPIVEAIGREVFQEAERIAREAALEAERQAARDARYAARKARKRKGR